jgi:hypothetical protein
LDGKKTQQYGNQAPAVGYERKVKTSGSMRLWAR